ncbi:MAG: pyridoxamine 5'-phosphate oxidase family protein [Christensenellales bacterium]|jgi:nitroimidazol reductase NimA-like FMN-containing flavoprotein (pyridoxamine 5'-phosphate oxidase superfamily)
MRRKEREKDRAFALDVVDQCVYAVLGCADAEGAPYAVPLSIARSGEDIYFHCARRGKKTDILRDSPRACLVCVGDVRVPKGRFAVEYESAVVTGTAREVTGDEEKVRALELISRRHTPENMHDFDAEVARFLAVTAVWKVRIEEISGKCKKYDDKDA